jgi:putative membrane protein
MSAEELGNLLAPVNACLNVTSATLLIVGFRYIKKGKALYHKRAMLGAFGASGLFLVFYLLRYSLTGTHEFAGTGVAKGVYLTILFSHMILAALIVPLIFRLLYLAWKDRTVEHARLARWTFPMWLYVSITGLVVYVLLYHVYGYV